MNGGADTMNINRKRLQETSFILLWIGFYFAYIGANNKNYVFLYISFTIFGLACLFSIA